MAIDEEHDDGLGGRGRRRREVTESYRYGEKLVELPAWHLDAIPLSESVRAAVDECARVVGRGARKRQIMRIDGLLREMDDEVLDQIGQAIANPPKRADPESVAAKWAKRVTVGDEEVEAFLAEFPQADRTRLRQLIRAGKAPNLLRYVREVLGV